MNEDSIWLEHLGQSLKATKQLAYLYHHNQDSFQFMGDVFGILGCEDIDLPLKKTDFLRFIHPEDFVERQLSISEIVNKVDDKGKSYSISYRIKRSDSVEVPIIETGVITKFSDDQNITIQGLMVIDTEKIERQKKLFRKMGFREAVSSSFSGGNDRRQLIDRIDEILSLEGRDITKGYLLLVEVDRVSFINQVYGHSFTDELLEKIGLSLKTLVASQAELVRIAGDIFAIVFPNSAHGEMHDTAQKILTVFYSQPMHVQGRNVHQVLSIGGVKLRDEAVVGSQILGHAELALNDAKQKGRGCFIEYSDLIGEEVKTFTHILSIGDEFLKNFKEGRVKMAFQGVISSRTQNVSFYECLIRMIDDNGQVHSAGKFIEAVEKMGLTRLVDTFATKEAIRELKDSAYISLSVNVSNHTLTDVQWLKTVVYELRDYPDVARRLIIEITESVAMNDINHTLRVIRTLQDLGCRIALDDFGVGQTAFSHLKDLSLDIVKIDKSFIQDMDKEENQHFIRTLHSLASAMNLETVGEGAETLREADILARDGIDHIQGYVHGLPTMDRLWLEDKKK